MAKRLAINDFEAWGIDEKGLFIALQDGGGSFWTDWEGLEDLTELIKRAKESRK